MKHYHTEHNTSGNIKLAFILNLSFTVFELIGGLFTNSVAILTDALHDLGDSLSLGLAWYFQRLSTRNPDKSYTFGYHRFSVLGAVINALVLLTGSFVVLYESIPRIMQPENIKVEGMFFLAIIGILVNGAAVIKLRQGKSVNERVVSLHMLEDVLGWAAVLIGSIIMYFFDLPIIDPLLSIGITLFILFNVFRNVKSSLKIILQASPDDKDMDAIEQKITALPHIRGVHDVHLWTMDGEFNIMTLHVTLNNDMTIENTAIIKQQIKELMEAEQIQHITVEFELKEEACDIRHQT